MEVNQGQQAAVQAPVQEGQQGPQVEGAENLLQQSNQPQENKTEYNSLPAQDKEIISNFVKYFGQPKAGQEIVINNGKPSLYMKINGKPVIRSLQEIFDGYSMSTASEEDLMQAKIKMKSAETKEKELGDLINTFYTDPELFMQLSREKGYTDEQIGKISASLLERVLKSADSPKEVKEAEKLKREYEALKAEKDALIKEKETAAFTAKQNEEYIGIKKEIYKVMTDNNLLEDEEVAEDIIISIANQMRYAAQNKVNLSADQALKIVMGKIPSYIDIVYRGLSDNQIRKLLPERIIKIARGETAPDLRSTQTSNSLKGGVAKAKAQTTHKKKTFAETFNI